MSRPGFLSSVSELAALVPSGSQLAIGKNQTGVPCELVRALVRQKVTDLHVVGVPTGGYAIDLLIGAGCVAAVESSAVTLDETGSAPRFINAIKTGRIRMIDSTCPAVYAGLSAGEKGIPFIPIRGLIGSDIEQRREDYQIVDNPFRAKDPIVVVPAITPDFALLHAPMADDHGNVYFGTDRDLELMAHAAKSALVTVEARYEGNLMDSQAHRAASLSSIYVGGVAIAERGAWPLGLAGYYEEDLEHMREYRQQALTDAAFADYVERHVAA